MCTTGKHTRTSRSKALSERSGASCNIHPLLFCTSMIIWIAKRYFLCTPRLSCVPRWRWRGSSAGSSTEGLR